MPISDADILKAYHERTKHRLERFARGPEYLDWDDQPAPFRRFHGAAERPLPLTADGLRPSFGQLLASEVPPAPLNLDSLGALCELSLGLAAWKQYGPQRWALRCNPSSGNLHPTEGYVLTAGVPDLADGVYHYAPEAHALEQRAACPWPSGGPRLLVALASIPRREAWKYGERAFRYVQLDAGHALGAIRIAAAALGWGLRLRPATDADLSALLGLDRPQDFPHGDREIPDLVLETGPELAADGDLQPWVQAAAAARWSGAANALGGEPRIRWKVIEEAEAASRIRRPPGFQPPAPARPPQIACDTPAVELIRGRRSAQAYDGRTGIARDAFHRLLDALLPGTPPLDCWPLRPRIHPVLFVHRVDGLAPGLYALPRTPAAEQALQDALDPEFLWAEPEACPPHLPLRLLRPGECRKVAKVLSCHQAIAAEGAFSLAMLADLDQALGEDPANYRYLHWEAGLLGQALYLQAEVAGLGGTGIGCFFDDPVHETLGLCAARFQSLYHFTIGGPLTDLRIQSLPPYGHLQRPADPA